MKKKSPGRSRAKASGNRRGHATQSEMAKRVEKIGILLVEGRSRPYILEFCAKKYKLADRATDEIIKRASEEILELGKVGIEDARARVLEGFYSQYRKCSKSPGTASDILQKIAKIYGLEQIRIKVDRPLEEAGDEDLEQAAAAGRGA